MLLVEGMDAVDHRLEVALDDRERRAQLVGDVGEKTPALVVARLEPRRHLVEGTPPACAPLRAPRADTRVE